MGRNLSPTQVWIVFLRLLMGFYWLYFSSQKWLSSAWVKPILEESAKTNPIPFVRSILLALVIPNSEPITVFQTILEAAIGTMLLIGLLTRVAGTVGALLASTLLLSFFGSLDAPVLVWFYALSVILSLTVAFSDAGKKAGFDRLLEKKWPNPPLHIW